RHELRAHAGAEVEVRLPGRDRADGRDRRRLPDLVPPQGVDRQPGHGRAAGSRRRLVAQGRRNVEYRAPVTRILAPLLVVGLAATTARAEKAVGYVAGAKTTLRITEVEGKNVEVKTAKAFRVMAKAASKKGVDLRIRSGFRTFA